MVDKTNFSRTVSILVIREVKESSGPRNVGLLTQMQPENMLLNLVSVEALNYVSTSHLQKVMFELNLFQ